MIYLDNAATTLIKPKNVHLAAADALKKCGNPGRGGHAPSMYAASALYECRRRIAKLFNTEKSPENIIFTLNATHALNIAIKSILHNGGHAVISSLEHNSVLRPLNKLKSNNVTFSIADCPIFAPDSAVQSFEKCIKSQLFIGTVITIGPIDIVEYLYGKRMHTDHLVKIFPCILVLYFDELSDIFY